MDLARRPASQSRTQTVAHTLGVTAQRAGLIPGSGATADQLAAARAAGDGPGKPVTVRLDEQTLAALRKRAEHEGLANESEAIRAAVRAWAHVA